MYTPKNPEISIKKDIEGIFDHTFKWVIDSFKNEFALNAIQEYYFEQFWQMYKNYLTLAEHLFLNKNPLCKSLSLQYGADFILDIMAI
mgnify:CR=1 FL=1